MSKENSKVTKIKHRFGAFEVRISDDKVEIEDYIHKQRKYVYGNRTSEYSAFLILLGETKATEEGYVAKTSSEKKTDKNIAEFLTYILNTTQLLFTDVDLRNTYMEAVSNLLSKQTVVDTDESEQEILDNLKTEHEAKEILNEEIQG